MRCEVARAGARRGRGGMAGDGVEAFDNDAWKNKRLKWTKAMWLNRGWNGQRQCGLTEVSAGFEEEEEEAAAVEAQKKRKRKQQQKKKRKMKQQHR